MKETTKNILIAILCTLLVAGGTFIGIQWNKTVSIWEKDAEREVFKETTTYNEAAATFLADCYKQYNDAETEKDKNTIMEYVVMRYPNLNYEHIENRTLRNFYKDCIEH